MRMRMSTFDVGMRLGDAIDPFQLANGFEAVIGYECQERSNPPFSHSYDTYKNTEYCSQHSVFSNCWGSHFGVPKMFFRNEGEGVP